MIGRKILQPIVFLLLLLSGLRLSCQTDTIPLQAEQTGSRQVELSWNASGEVSIYRRFVDEPDKTLIGTSSSGSYTDHLHRSVCDDTVYYSINVSSGGVTHLGFAAIQVSDNEPTAPAEWGVVTVDQSTHLIHLSWQASQDTDILGYLICEGSPSIAIDTVYGRTNTEYEFTDGSDIEVYLFRICAFDSCRQASSLTDACNNMVVLLSAEPCSQTIVANWNAYIHMPSEVDHYELWVREDYDDYRDVAHTLPNTTETTFTISSQCRKVYAYVKAVSTDGTTVALSNRARREISAEERPGYLYLRKVSVCDDGRTVNVIGQTDPTFPGTDYLVYRKSSSRGTEVAGHVQPTPDGVLTWIDHEVQPRKELYTYWFGVMDGCGRNEILSQKGSTLLPEIEEDNGVSTITWNPYEGWEGAVTYMLVSCPLGETIWTPVASSMETTVSGIISDNDGEMTYKVLAFEGPDSRWQRNDSLQSSVIFRTPKTVIWMPNAFTPLESTNNTVSPKSTFIETQGYHMLIYNRMGAVVFETHDPLEAWDGTSNGVMQPVGAYTYIIKYRQNDNTDQVLKGTVTLIK